jgi:hypothetical protein
VTLQNLHRAPTVESADAFCNQQPKLMQKTHLQLYYSRERLITWEAKREFVEPDLTPLVSLPKMRNKERAAL